MAILKAFKGFRPKKEFAAKIASRPYDVLNSEEAREEVLKSLRDMNAAGELEIEDD